MPWDGSGNFTREHNWQTDRDAAVKILASRHDEEDDNLATGIAACLTKNGETKPTATFSPNATRSYDLGSTSLRWRSPYLSGSINVQSATAAAATTVAFTDATEARTITIPNSTGTMLISPSSSQIEFSGIFNAKIPDVTNLRLNATVSGNALTIALKGNDGNDPSSTNPVYIPFRSATAATGDTTWVSVTAANSLVISSGSTLGTTSGAISRIWIVALNDAGTLRLGAINCATSTNIYSLSDDTIVSSTTEGGGGAADSAGVIYSGTGVSSKAMRILGYVESTQATAGTWATSPSKVQLWTSGMKLPGDRVQTTITTSAALASTSTQIPVDDTSPQNTEGAELMTRSITPVSAANLLIVQVTVLFSVSDQATGTVALFQDNNANALAVVAGRSDAASTPATVTFTYFVISGTASSTTFKVRGGPGSAHTFYFNGSGGNRLFNGVAASSISITEVSV